jgi:hypothetical protein
MKGSKWDGMVGKEGGHPWNALPPRPYFKEKFLGYLNIIRKIKKQFSSIIILDFNYEF